jgi:hypothetical protein
MRLDLRRLRDYAVYAHCPKCRHHAVVNPVAATRVPRWEVPLPVLRERLT